MATTPWEPQAPAPPRTISPASYRRESGAGAFLSPWAVNAFGVLLEEKWNLNLTAEKG